VRPGQRDDDDPRSVKLRRIERGVEERLARMAEAGELSGLPGEGRPFPDRGPDAAGDRWAAYRVMANNKVLPCWAQLRREIEAEVERIARAGRAHRDWARQRREQLVRVPAERILETARATRDRDARMRAELESAVRVLDVKVERFNSLVPVESLQLALFRVEAFL
jgi:hypothetical protein